MFDEINAWDAELRCSDTLKLTNENLFGKEILCCEYHRFDKAGIPLPFGELVDSEELRQEGPLIFLSGGGYIYSIYKDSSSPGPLYSTFGCDEAGKCFDPRDARQDIGEETKHEDKKSPNPNYFTYEYWKRHPIGK